MGGLDDAGLIEDVADVVEAVTELPGKRTVRGFRVGWEPVRAGRSLTVAATISRASVATARTFERRR